jgi:hypothetical protein
MVEIFPWQTKEREVLQRQLKRLWGMWAISTFLIFISGKVYLNQIKYNLNQSIKEKEEEITKLTDEKINLENMLINRNVELEESASDNFYLNYEQVMHNWLKTKKDSKSRQAYNYFNKLEKEVKKYSKNEGSFKKDVVTRYIHEYCSSEKFIDYAKITFTPEMLNFLDERAKKN